MSYPLFNEELFADSVSKLKNNSNYLGEGFPDEFLSSVYRWRGFFIQSPMYGHQIGKNVSIVSHYPFSLNPDIFISDSDGVLKNRIDENRSTQARITEAKKNGVKVVAFFGGSTIQGYGSRLPQYSIPSLVEELYYSKYDQQILCINYGVAGWTCKEALNFLMHDMHDGVDLVIAYDGWNCCHELFMRELSVKFKFFERLSSGSSFRHYEQAYLGKKSYEFYYNFRRSFNILVNKILTILSAKMKPLSPFLNKILQKFFSLVDRRFLLNLLDERKVVYEEECDIISKVADDYVRTHQQMASICKSQNIEFIAILQPLLSTTNKPLTLREADFKKSGLPWGNPGVYPLFCKQVISKASPLDFTNIFSGVIDELFIDNGHVNMHGNTIIARNIVNLLVASEIS